VKVALPVVRGLHGSRTEGTTRRFKVGDFKTEFNGLRVLRTDIRTVPGRRRGDRIGERMSAFGVRRAKAALSSGCKPHWLPATAPILDSTEPDQAGRSSDVRFRGRPEVMGKPSKRRE
jgi:hypothetical protein